MKRAGIAELKNRLSYYLRCVRRGETVLVCDRDRPIARIEPVRDAVVAAGDLDDTVELERTGVVRPPQSVLPKNWLARRVEVNADVVGALLAERNEGR
jgi:prevent-host-death family protein